MVDWQDGAIIDPAPATDEQVRAAERALRVRFPADFLAVAQPHPGAAPVPATFDLPDGSSSAVAHLLHFADEPFFTNIVARRFPVEGVIPKGVIPFAEDVGGDLICFDHRTDYDAPPIAFWSVDTGRIRLAGTFTEFVALLRD